jgi:hypothetical protein
MADQIEALRTTAATALSATTQHAQSVAVSDGAARAAAIANLRTARAKLDELLRAVARYGLPQALRLVTNHELIVAPLGYAEQIGRVLALLDGKRAELRSAASEADPAAARPKVNAAVERARRALCDACDGEALPIWLPFTKGIPLPSLQGPATELPADIASWALLRPKLGQLAEWFASAAGARVWWIDDQRWPFDATDVLDPPDRPDDERPPSRHYAMFVGFPGNALDPVATLTRCAGFVVDEWSEFRPSALQHSALAVNYDAPQSEPPHALLLGVPTSAAPWSHASAAALVRDTIRMMQMRALPSREAAFSQFAGRWFSVIPPKGNERRIPTRTRPTIEVPDFPVAVARVAARPPASHTAGDLDERRRPGDDA